MSSLLPLNTQISMSYFAPAFDPSSIFQSLPQASSRTEALGSTRAIRESNKPEYFSVIALGAMWMREVDIGRFGCFISLFEEEEEEEEEEGMLIMREDAKIAELAAGGDAAANITVPHVPELSSPVEEKDIVEVDTMTVEPSHMPPQNPVEPSHTPSQQPVEDALPTPAPSPPTPPAPSPPASPVHSAACIPRSASAVPDKASRLSRVWTPDRNATVRTAWPWRRFVRVRTDDLDDVPVAKDKFSNKSKSAAPSQLRCSRTQTGDAGSQYRQPNFQEQKEEEVPSVTLKKGFSGMKRPVEDDNGPGPSKRYKMLESIPVPAKGKEKTAKITKAAKGAPNKISSSTAAGSSGSHQPPAKFPRPTQAPIWKNHQQPSVERCEDLCPASSDRHPPPHLKNPSAMVGNSSKRTPPSRPTPTSADGRNLRSSSQNTNRNDSEGAHKGPSSNPEEAHQYLLSKRLVPEQQLLTFHSLSTALLHLAEAQASIPKATEEGIRAVAMLIDDLAQRTTISEVATIIKERLSGANDMLAPTIQKMEKAVQVIDNSTNRLTGTVEELRQESDGTAQRIIEAVNEQIATTSATTSDEKTPASAATTRYPTYAAALAACATKPVSLQCSMLMKCELRARQILVDKVPNAPEHQTYRLSEPDILSQANQAIEALEWDDEQEKPKVVGIQRLPTSGYLLEFNTEEAAELFQEQQRAERLLTLFDQTSMIKPTSYTIIVEFVPVRFEPSAQSNLDDVENLNALEKGNILAARWIKPTERRSDRQTTAHLILQLRNRTAANTLIRLGVLIAGTRTMARKLTQEAKRCLKCQRLGTAHLAAQCPQPNDTCGTCGEEGHRTSACVITDPTKYRCVNCDRIGHAAWDRDCPTFKERSNKIQQRNPETSMRYFPSSRDPQTWEMLHTSQEVTLPPPGPNTATALSCRSK
ncbi:hypothetical protein JB92DRAFT_3118072 [Gautieria morchelliformis]|nr:hypothetical protein JB92DRAFT_3118072 [Gautieria morchelliformis]